MAGFTAATVVEPLKYSLKPYVDKTGTVKEPSDTQLDDFDRAITEETQRLRKLVPKLPDRDDADAYLAAVEEAERANVSDEATSTFEIQARIHADLCSGEPSFDDLMALPRRVRMHFFNWLNKEVSNPEAGAAAGN